MTNETNHKSSNKENKKNDMNRPLGEKKNTKNPPKFENFSGNPMY
jgi:hypothetical protein